MSGDEAPAGAEGMSKKKMKRLKRYGGAEGVKEHWEKRKKEYKERVKERKKVEKEKKQKEWDELSDGEKERRKKEANEQWSVRQKEREELEKKIEEATANPGARPQLVIDMDFESEMEDKCRRSLAQQVALCHSHNRKAGLPCWLTLAGLKESSTAYSVLTSKQNFENWKITTTPVTVDKHLPADPEKTIYLTGDSPNVLTDLKPGVHYVVGGIVDRNRCKGITLKKATACGFGHARFPLDTYLQKKKVDLCKTLTTNHVVEVITHFCVHKDWDAAFDAILPTRRAKAQAKGDAKPTDDTEEHEEAEEDDDSAEGKAKRQKTSHEHESKAES
eukprot:TRINITY_DN6880_c0_g1_i1.p1 TRINITY_DN6880_c0_g1~~TRINITY_DN6880_c0_g1_i1.p1  ORF type:complete len:332 (+),score=113.73 TRINITY_DN6880_c0_g1_i1:31-1026(+)